MSLAKIRIERYAHGHSAVFLDGNEIKAGLINTDVKYHMGDADHVVLTIIGDIEVVNVERTGGLEYGNNEGEDQG